MTTATGNVSAQPVSCRPPSLRFAVLVSAAFLGFAGALAALPVLVALDMPIYLALGLPAAVFAMAVFLWNTQAGLCFTAFAIGPLGIIQYEVVGITVNLPEVLILMIFTKEFLRFAASGEKPSPAVPWRTFWWLMAAWALGLLVGVLRGNGFVGALQDWRQYTEFVVLYLLVVHRVPTRRKMKQVLACYLAGATLLALHGILQRYTGIGIAATQLISDAVFHGAIRSGSLYGATPLGGLMVLALGVCAAMALSTLSMTVRLAVGACGAACLAAAVFTNTRASWIAIAIAMVYVFVSVRKTKGLILVTVLGALAFSAVLGPIVVRRMGTIEISKTERSLLERVQYYTAAWHIFRAHPVLGLGFGCDFNVQEINLNGQYFPPERHHRIVDRTQWDRATVHSAYLQILVRTGLVGLIPLLVFLWIWFFRNIRERLLREKDELDHNLFVGLAGSLLGYLCHAGLENFFQWAVMAQSFWLLLGLSTVVFHGLHEHGEVPKNRTALEAPTAAGSAEEA